jgi:5-hydroxyisourate hydrolase
MGRLTTHVLDAVQGKPGAGISIELFRLGATRERLASATTNADGRCERPLLEGPAFTATMSSSFAPAIISPGRA